MKVLIASSNNGDLRSEFWGWTEEDSDLFVPNKSIGMTPSPKYEHPKTAMEALHNEWKLLSPPIKEHCEQIGEFWTWWFTKEKKNEV